jgi:hypothetical protein
MCNYKKVYQYLQARSCVKLWFWCCLLSHLTAHSYTCTYNYQVPLLVVNDSMPGLQISFTSVYPIKRTLFNIYIILLSLNMLYLRQHLTSTSPSLLHFDTLRLPLPY